MLEILQRRRRIFSRPVYIVWTGMTKMQGRYPDKTYVALAQMLAKKMCQELGPWFTMNLIQSAHFGIYNTNFEGQEIPATTLMGPLGLHLTPQTRYEAGGATGLTAFKGGVCSIASGESDLAFVLGVEKAQDSYDLQTNTTTPEVINTIALSWPFYERPLGITASSCYQQCIFGWMARYSDDLQKRNRALMAARMCEQGLANNPLAQRYPEKITAEQIENSRIIIGDIGLGEVCVYSEGSAGALLACKEVAREIQQQTGLPIFRVEGIGAAQESLILGRGHKRTDIIESDYVAAKRAYEMAGVLPSQIGAASIHDAFTPQLEITLNLSGFAPFGKFGPEYWGQADRLVTDGIVMSDNPILIVNHMGGLLYGGHPVGASNLFSLHEACRCLAVTKRELAFVHGTGGARAAITVVAIIRQISLN